MRSFLTLIIFIIGYGVFKNKFSTGFDLLTDGTILCMFIILLLDAVFARIKLNNINLALKKSIDKLNGFENSTQAFAEFREDFFGNKFLDEKLHIFLKDEYQARTDIANYINEDVISDYTYREITNLISGSMTGLGIFGTFVGLTAGLQGFDAAGTQDVIIKSITNLMDGIKVAFYTSVFGVAASLVYNYFYKTDIRKNVILLEKMYDAFYRLVPPQDTFKTALIKMQDKQTEALTKLSSDIAGELAKAMNESVVPTMSELKNATFGYIEKAVATQSETLDKIVAEFMVKLNKSLKNQFNDLSDSINEMCRWQNEMTGLCKSLSDVGSELMNTSNAITETQNSYKRIFVALESSTTRMGEYIYSLNTYQNDVEQTILKLNNITVNHENITKQQMDAAEKLSLYFSTSDDYIKNVEKTYELGKEYIISVKDVADAFGEISKIHAITVAASVKSVEQYENSAKQLKECTKQLLNLNEQLTEEVSKEVQDRIYQKLSAEIEEHTDALRKIVVYQSETSKNLLQAAEKIQSPIKRLLDAIANNTKNKLNSDSPKEDTE